MNPSFSAQDALKLEDIPRMMDRLFHFHIENKELTPSLIRRAFKLYIEQFDVEKMYLLEDEVAPYLNLQTSQLQEILSRIKQKNFSDYLELNRLCERAAERAKKLRTQIAAQLLSDPEDLGTQSMGILSQYAKTEAEILERQKNKMVRFYLFHQARTKLDSLERKKMVYDLFEKKMRRFESSFIFIQTAAANERMEHLLTLRIMKSLAKSLDTHTAFFSHEEAAEMRLSLEKQFEGVGVILSESVDGVAIADLIEGSPAEQSGQIKINDLLVEIDGRSIAMAPFEDVLHLLKQKDRSEMVLGFRRFDASFQNETFFRVSLKKRPISMKNDRIQTSFERVEGGVIGKISLHSFYENSDGVSSEKDIKEAIRGFRTQGELKGLILDLRENSGGFLGQAVRVAGLFVANGVIVISKYGKGETHYLRNLSGKSYFDGPLVVLTSKMSASASEIVAQALQDYGVAVIVGDKRTFGKGSIQYQTITDERADLFFKVTVGRYYTVSGKSTQIDGVSADLVVPTQYAPYYIGERYLEYPLARDRVQAAYLDPLTDLDERTRLIFKKRYLPYLQQVVVFWKQALPVLRKNSIVRMEKDEKFQNFLNKLEIIRSHQTEGLVNTVGESFDMRMEDFPMKEAVWIVKDMIQIQVESDAGVLQATGSDS